MSLSELRHPKVMTIGSIGSIAIV
jgi:hypothetical protein